MKNLQTVVSVRIPIETLAAVDKYVQESDIKISRSAAIVFLIERGLTEQGYEVKE